MKFYILGQFDVRWGGYGDVLVSGFYRRENPDGPMLLHRTGPFLPPISFPYCSPDHGIVVSVTLKQQLEIAPFPGIKFKKTVLDRIIPLNWHEWDPKAPEPKRRPPEGEPENYIWDKKHSPKTASKMGEAWELICPVIPCVFSSWLGDEASKDGIYRQTLILLDQQYVGLFCASPGGRPIVDEPTKKWFESKVPEWVRFVPLKLEYDPRALEKLEALRKHNQEIASHLTSDEYRHMITAFCERNGYAIPPAFNRQNLSAYRYCIVQLESTPPKLSVMTYSSYDGLADYVEHKLKVSPSPETALSNLLIYDLETKRRLLYQGHKQFLSTEWKG